jgi:hypothetical protein
MQFHEAKLLLKGSKAGPLSEPFDIHTLEMGKVTVKIYNGILDGSSIGQQPNIADAYQPGEYLGTATMRCCCDYDVGKQYLCMEDYNRISRAQLKRKEQQTIATGYSGMEVASKRMRTESGFVPMAVNGGSMKYDSVNAAMAES